MGSRLVATTRAVEALTTGRDLFAAPLKGYLFVASQRRIVDIHSL